MVESAFMIYDTYKKYYVLGKTTEVRFYNLARPVQLMSNIFYKKREASPERTGFYAWLLGAVEDKSGTILTHVCIDKLQSM